MTDFAEHRKRHLAEYKKSVLKISASGCFKHGGKIHRLDHILPTAHKANNIIRHYRKEFYASAYSGIQFHKYFHHLNSSQALCINLFFPLMNEHKLELLWSLSGFPKVPQQPVNESCFEKESALETGQGRRTNFDFYVRLAAAEIYFEIKFTEAEFGKADPNDEHIKKYRDTYQPLLENNPCLNSAHCKRTSFLENYQVMRNLCHVGENRFVVFVYPKANKKVHQQAVFARDEILTAEGRARFGILHLESIIGELIRRAPSEAMQNHYREFKQKYFPDHA